MDVQVGEVNTTLRMMDSQALLNPQVKESLFREFLARMRDDEQQQGALDEGRTLRPNASAQPAQDWRTS